MKKRMGIVVAALAAAGLAAPAGAVNVGVFGKVVSVKTNNVTGKFSLKSVQKDPLITFGGAGNPALLSGTLEVQYIGTGNAGALSMPAPWLSNTGITAKFKNTLAPAGPSPVKSASVKVAGSAKVSSKGLGGLSIVSPPPVGGVLTILTINNGASATITRLCTRYSVADGSIIVHKVLASGNKLVAKRGVPVACPPSCTDGVQNGSETDVDCGGASCPDCGPGDNCNSGSDCSSGVCTGGICQAPSCSDGVKNGNETGVDCGGSCVAGCGFNNACVVNSDCDTGLSCVGGVCKCNNHLFTFTVNSNNGGAFDSAEWPGGTTAQSNGSGCSVTINRPNNNIDLVCALASPFSVNSRAGYSSCFGTGGEDGDGCSPVSCPPLGIGSCCQARPSCSAALNGSGSANYFVQCLQ